MPQYSRKRRCFGATPKPAPFSSSPIKWRAQSRSALRHVPRCWRGFLFRMNAIHCLKIWVRPSQSSWHALEDPCDLQFLSRDSSVYARWRSDNRRDEIASTGIALKMFWMPNTADVHLAFPNTKANLFFAIGYRLTKIRSFSRWKVRFWRIKNTSTTRWYISTSGNWNKIASQNLFLRNWQPKNAPVCNIP